VGAVAQFMHHLRSSHEDLPNNRWPGARSRHHLFRSADPESRSRSRI